jgi:hypothetical protein
VEEVRAFLQNIEGGGHTSHTDDSFIRGGSGGDGERGPAILWDFETSQTTASWLVSPLPELPAETQGIPAWFQGAQDNCIRLYVPAVDAQDHPRFDPIDDSQVRP